MNTHSNSIIDSNPFTVAQLAINYPEALGIFTKYNIDYCCGGHRTFDEACNRAGLDPNKIRAEILHAKTETALLSFRPENWSLAFLIDYIVQNHHRYVQRAVPEISVFLDKVCDAHGDDCIALLQIRQNFIDLAEELTGHMEKEELALFPAVKQLEAQGFSDHPLSLTIQAPVHAMEHEHTIAGDLVKQIRALSNHYTPPDFACPTFSITYQKLKEFDDDLMKHVHLENNILFKKVKELGAQNSCSL